MKAFASIRERQIWWTRSTKSWEWINRQCNLNCSINNWRRPCPHRLPLESSNVKSMFVRMADIIVAFLPWGPTYALGMSTRHLHSWYWLGSINGTGHFVTLLCFLFVFVGTQVAITSICWWCWHRCMMVNIYRISCWAYEKVSFELVVLCGFVKSRNYSLTLTYKISGNLKATWFYLQRVSLLWGVM